MGLTGPWRWIVPGLGALLLIGIIVGGITRCQANEAASEQATFNNGVTTERANSQGETLNALATSKNAVEHPTGDQLNRVCGRYDRNCPANGS